MEKFGFTAIIDNKPLYLVAEVVQAHITERSLLTMLLRRFHKEARGSAVMMEGHRCVPIAAAELLLRKGALATILAENVVPAIANQSVSVRAEAELEHQRVAARSAEVTIVGRELEGLDLFRKAASEAPAHLRIHPDIIQGAVSRGAFVGFQKVEDFWGDGPPVFNHLDYRLSNDDFQLDAFKHNRSAGRIITGPELQAASPDHPLLKRRTIPAYYMVEAVGSEGLGRDVLVPEHKELFPWELDLGTKPEGVP